MSEYHRESLLSAPILFDYLAQSLCLKASCVLFYEYSVLLHGVVFDSMYYEELNA